MDVTNARYTNAEHTVISAVIDGREWHGITEQHRFWPHIVAGDVKPFEPPAEK